MAYIGPNTRLRRVVSDLITGHRPIKIAVIGGSVSWGLAAEVGKNDWFTVFSRYMSDAFPRAELTFTNGCVPSTGTPFMILCLELYVNADVDLVFSEYMLNDGALILQHNGFVSRGVPTELDDGIESGTGIKHALFADTPEDAYGAVSQYYGAPSLSLRSAVYRLAMAKRVPGFQWKDIMHIDRLHPSVKGHKCMADLAVWLIQQTALDVFMRPMAKEDVEMVTEPLPDPIFPNNLPPAHAMCLWQEMLRPAVVESDGWEFINEGTEEKPKKGYVTTTPDVPLTLCLNTSSDGSNFSVTVAIAHLKSYDENMGIATVSCVANCSCTPVLMDGWHTDQSSQTYMATVTPTQHEACIMAITVHATRALGTEDGQWLPGTKFKVSGVMFTEGSNNVADDQDRRFKATGWASGLSETDSS
ncbi:hypothetical protein FOA52_013612 [Chlamydomonas sp. UWO 241]|nr:hypothetical protein FOA52_013612 [Chlamydomonas sp. UWO 241]